MRKANLILCCAVGGVVGCSGGVDVTCDLANPVEYQVYREGIYSTQNQVGEVVGTVMRWWTTENLVPQGDGAVWSRKYDMQKHDGYHRHSLPSELAIRVPVRAHVTPQSIEKISGFSLFSSDVVDLLPVRKGFKEPLRDSSLIPRFEKELRLWWKATHLLSGKFRAKGNITSAVAAVNGGTIDLAPLQVDSIVALGDVKVEERSCFNYRIDYKLDAVPDLDLIFEQFRAADTVDRAAFADFSVASGKAKGTWNIWIDPKNGHLCREQDWRDLSIVVAHKESGEHREITARTAIEQLYTYNLEEQLRRFQRRGE